MGLLYNTADATAQMTTTIELQCHRLHVYSTDASVHSNTSALFIISYVNSLLVNRIDNSVAKYQ